MPPEKSRRQPAWGVLGLATGDFGSPYSPCLFSGVIIHFNPAFAGKFRCSGRVLADTTTVLL
jgi:hypothetical protein